MRHVLHEHKLEITLVPKHLKRPQDERRSLDRRIARRVHDPRPAVTFWRMHRYRFNIHTAVGEKFSPPDIPAQLRIEIECPIRFRQDFGKKFPTLVILLRDARGKQAAGIAPTGRERKLRRFSGNPDIATLQGEEYRLPKLPHDLEIQVSVVIASEVIVPAQQRLPEIEVKDVVIQRRTQPRLQPVVQFRGRFVTDLADDLIGAIPEGAVIIDMEVALNAELPFIAGQHPRLVPDIYRCVENAHLPDQLRHAALHLAATCAGSRIR